MKFKEQHFDGCNIDKLGRLVARNGQPVIIDVREFDTLSFEIRIALGSYATAVLTLQGGNCQDPIATATTYSAPASAPRVKHTGAIDVTAYAYVGLEVTTVEGSAGTVDVFAIAKSKYT